MVQSRRLALALLPGLLLTFAVLVRADQPTAVQPAEAFWFDPPRQAAAGAAQLVLIRSPLLVLPLLMEGKRNLVWGLEEEPPLDQVPPLDPKLLSLIQDKKPLPDLRKKPKEEWSKEEKAEYDVYCDAVKYAAATPPQVFAKNAEENKHVTWGHMFREPWKYRGKVIHVKGRLKRVRREDAPLCAQKELINVIYEGWVFTETQGSNPVAVVFIELPKGIKEGESISHEVSFDGYFLKRYRYVSGEGPRDTLLFIAPTLKTQGKAEGGDKGVGFGNFSAGFLLTVAGLVGVVGLLIVGLNLWYRRGDRNIHSRLDRVRSGMFASPDGAEDTPPEQVTAIRAELPPGHPRILPPPEAPPSGSEQGEPENPPPL